MSDTDKVVLEEVAPGNALDDGLPDAVHETLIEVSAVLGTVPIPIYQLLQMGRGAVIALDRALDDPIEIRANNHLIARGDVVIIEDRIGVSITENVAPEVVRRNR